MATRRDSAGIEIVLNDARAEAVPVYASLDTVPEVRIGALGGSPEEQFGTVRDLVALPGGGVAVLDSQAGEVRLFDEGGRFIRSIGSLGEGPGELQSPIAVALLPGDTLAVYDPVPNRVTRFSLDGAAADVISVVGGRARVVAASFLPDGRLVAQSVWISPEGRDLSGADPTYVRDTAVVAVIDRAGTTIDTLDVVPGRETITKIEQRGQVFSVFRRPTAFGRTNVFASHPDGVWSTENDRFALELHDADGGGVLRVVRAPGLERPIGPGQLDAVLDRALEEVESERDVRDVERWFELSPKPEQQPAYDLIAVDAQARLWVRAWSALDPPARWWVFDPTGALLGSVDVPNGLVVEAIGCDFVWGVERDELDVSYVVRYAMRDSGDC